MLDTNLDIPLEDWQEQELEVVVNHVRNEMFMYDILLAHKVLQSGVPNRFGCIIPVSSYWNIELLRSLLVDYHDIEVTEWMMYGFSISRDDLHLCNKNHKSATQFPEIIDKYFEREIEFGATMGPFNIPPFINRIGTSPISTCPKRDSTK